MAAAGWSKKSVKSTNLLHYLSVSRNIFSKFSLSHTVPLIRIWHSFAVSSISRKISNAFQKNKTVWLWWICSPQSELVMGRACPSPKARRAFHVFWKPERARTRRFLKKHSPKSARARIFTILGSPKPARAQILGPSGTRRA